MGYIYFIQSREGHIKIGFTKDVRKRFMQLQRNNSQELVLLGVMEGDMMQERFLHDAFEKWRVRGEWYESVEPINRYIGQNVDEDLRPDLRHLRRTGKRVV